MNTGTLWWDNSQSKTLTTKVCEAAQYFRRKFNHVPELCLVNPVFYANDKDAVLEVDVFGEFKVTVRPYRSILPDHLWIGFEEEPVRVEVQESEVPE